METIWKTKHKNIPSPNSKLLKRSYKIPKPHIVFPWRNKTTSWTTRRNRHEENLHTQRNKNHRHKHILIFNKSTTPTSIRIGYINTRIETCIPNPLRCQKYGHHKDKWTRPPIRGKSNHIELEGKNPFKCTEHPAYSQECEMWKKKNCRNEIRKKHLLPRGQKNRTQEQPCYAYVTKKGNVEKKIQNQNKNWTNWLMNFKKI